MPRHPLTTYRTLLERAGRALGTDDPGVTRARLYTLLLPEKQDDAIAAVLDELQISAGYARGHLLSIGGWPDDVVNALADGLSLAVARTLAQENAERHGSETAAREFRNRVLAEADTIAQRHASAKRARTNRDGIARRTPSFGARVTEAIERLRNEAANPPGDLEDGWLPPRPPFDTRPAPTRDVWIFPDVGPTGRDLEELHPDVIHALLARWGSAGDRVVDLTAGSGTVARVATQRGCPTWSSDIDPRHDFIHPMDARQPTWDCGLDPGCADAVFLHPPTYAAWRARHPDEGVQGRAPYASFVSEMIAGAAQILKPNGHLFLVSRPVRATNVVHTALGELQVVLEETGFRLVGYPLAVDAQGNDDWHILVGRMTTFDEAL